MRAIPAYFMGLILATLSFTAAQADDASQDALIMDSFEQPLLSELLKRGYTPRNAAIATQHLLEEFIRCWTSDRNAESHSEQSIVTVQLGGQRIVTYQSPCLSEFIGNVDSLP